MNMLCIILSNVLSHRFSNPNVRVVQEGTGIKSKRLAEIDCPADTDNICACEIKYRDSHLQDEAMSLHLVTDLDEVCVNMK